MAQASQSIQFSVALQASPQASPQVSPQVSPQFSPQISPQFSPQISPQFSPQISPQYSPQFSPASVVFLPQTRAERSELGEPKPFLQPRLVSPAGRQKPLTARQKSQVSGQLQSSGVDLEQLSKIAQESPFSLSQASSPADGSYVRPFGLDTGLDVAGWELYDGLSSVGTLILGVNNRIGILVEATNIFPNALLEIAGGLDFQAVDRACRDKTR
jgi:hypothetical protein